MPLPKDVQATTFYSLEDDGLRHPWPGTVFCNPPYKMPEVARFIGKLCEELDAKPDGRGHLARECGH